MIDTPNPRACACSEPDPVMQATGKFYCHTCSFETGARPRLLEPEEWYRQWREALARCEALTQERDEVNLRLAIVNEKLERAVSLARSLQEGQAETRTKNVTRSGEPKNASAQQPASTDREG